jgi:hypothetical protein
MCGGSDYVCWVLRNGTVDCAVLDGDVGRLALSAPASEVACAGEDVKGACARLVDGSIQCFRADISGEHWNVMTPVTVRDVIAFDTDYGHACALTGNGEVLCWDPFENTPPRVERFGRFPEASALSVGSEHACILDRGQVRCVGNNRDGSLGVPEDPGSEPVLVRDLPPVMAIASALDTTCAIDESTGVLCWGGSNPSGTTSFGRFVAPEDAVAIDFSRLTDDIVDVILLF